MNVRERNKAYFLGFLVLAAAVATAILLSYWLALRQLSERAQVVSIGLLKRTEEISIQIDRAFETLDKAATVNPCGPANLKLMREVALGAMRLQLVGYAPDGKLLCSSYGRHDPPIDLGPRSYLSSLGFELRTGRQLPFAGDTRFLLSTLKRSGYTVAVLPQLNNDFMSDKPAYGVGVYGASSRKPLYTSGVLQEAWLNLLPVEATSARAIDRELLVFVRRSERYDYAAYVALSLSDMHEDWRYYAAILVPLGVGTGLAMAVLLVALLRNRRSLNHQLRSALQRKDGLFLHFQPIVDLASGRWVGAEALLRWRQPDGSLVPPDTFIPMAERTGQIRKLSARMMELLERDVVPLWRAFPEFYISINLSAQDLADPQAVADLQALIQRAGVKPQQVMAEITERVLVHEETSRRHLALLRKSGVRVAIDDFGTGYCGLAYLTSLELDCLKIDKVFVDTIGTDAATRHVVGHIIEIGKSLELNMIAEGVETGAHADYLRQQGVPCAQGWFYARPMPCAELQAALERARAAV